VLHQPLRHAGLFFRIQPHALFGTTPQCIVHPPHPFVLDQIAQFGLVKLMPEMFA
jgi:hypothetical protein